MLTSTYVLNEYANCLKIEMPIESIYAVIRKVLCGDKLLSVLVYRLEENCGGVHCSRRQT